MCPMAGLFMLLTSVPAREMAAEDVLNIYRLRRQVELAFPGKATRLV